MINVPADIRCDSCGGKIPDAKLVIRPAPGAPYSGHQSSVTVEGAHVLPDGSVGCSDSCYKKLLSKTEHK